jgi:hypothetical protein
MGKEEESFARTLLDVNTSKYLRDATPTGFTMRRFVDDEGPYADWKKTVYDGLTPEMTLLADVGLAGLAAIFATTTGGDELLQASVTSAPLLQYPNNTFVNPVLSERFVLENNLQSTYSLSAALITLARAGSKLQDGIVPREERQRARGGVPGTVSLRFEDVGVSMTCSSPPQGESGEKRHVIKFESRLHSSDPKPKPFPYAHITMRSLPSGEVILAVETGTKGRGGLKSNSPEVATRGITADILSIRRNSARTRFM